MSDQPSSGFDPDAQTIVALGLAVCLAFVGLGGCCYLVSKGDALNAMARHEQSTHP